MAKEEIQISVKLQEAYKQARDILASAQSKGAFKGRQGEENLKSLNTSSLNISNLIAKGTLTATEFKELNKQFQDFIDKLQRASLRASELTEKVKNLQAQLTVALGNKTKASDKVNAARVKAAEARNKFVQSTTSATQTSGTKYYKLNTEGKLSQQELVNLETIQKNLNAGKLGVLQDGKAITNRAEVSEIVANNTAEIVATEKALKTAETKLANVEKTVEELQKKLDKQIEEDKAAGRNVSGLSSEALDVKQTWTQEYEQTQTKETEEEVNKIDANTKLAETNEIISKQPSLVTKAFKAFTFYNLVLRSIKRAARDAVETIRQLDSSLTEQAMVTGKTRAQTYELLKSYQDLALQCGATTKEVAEVSTQFLRQGKSTSEALALTNAAISAAKVANIGVTESVNYLTTALNGFRLSAEDAMNVSDKFAAVAAVSATSYDELATALSKVASQANLAGMSIDYTTALLAKGIETTREAPETIGTALKTIIARMRELSDYGETLEGDMDLNNVETQLGYIGIELKNQEGELRSTEDVLNDLGAKWDTLNTNQQAAVAKALAGTRQQARLIAMMTDYERVTELQEISSRSAGATMAQMETYMQGMDAALNKVSVAWEKIVTDLTNSDVINALIRGFGNILDTIANILDNNVAMVVTLTTVAGLGLNILGHKMQENQLAKQQAAYSLQQQKSDLEQNKIRAELVKATIKLSKEDLRLNTINAKNAFLTAQAAVNKKREAIAAKEARGEDASAEKIELQQLETTLQTTELLYEQAKAEEDKYLQAENILSTYDKQAEMLKSQEGLLGQLSTGWGGLLGLVTPFVPLLNLITLGWQKATSAIKRHSKAVKEDTKEGTTNALVKGSGSAADIPVVGWVIALALLAAAGVAALSATGLLQSATSKVASKVKELSADIYNLSKQANEVASIADSFDAIDNKLIKTNADLKEMNELLDSAADKISDEDVGKKDIGYGKGKSAKDYYEQFTTAAGKRAALDTIEKVSRDQMKKDYKEQIATLKSNTDWLTSNSTDALMLQEAVRKSNNALMYDSIDALKESINLTSEESAAIESLTQNLLENMDIRDAWALAKDESGQSILDFTKKIAEATTMVDGNSRKVAEVIGSTDYTLAQQAQAFRDMRDALGATSKEFEVFSSFYSDFVEIAKMSDDVLDFIERSGMSIDKVNKFYTSWDTLQKAGWQITQETWESNFNGMLELLAQTQGDIEQVINSFYATQIEELRQLYGDGSEFTEAYNALINSFGNLVEVGILNMGQNLDKFNNSISNFYQKASDWATMSENDKAQFISDNADYFAGASGAELLKAFKTGNYNMIERALAENAGIQKTIEDRLQEINQDLLIEEARIGDERNEAYISYLRQWKDKLENDTDLFRADLETLINQEQAQLDIYRDYLQQQQDELQDSLDKRKEAYEKYFNAINSELEQQDFGEKADTLMANLSKLASSTDATSKAKQKELEANLNDLEKERMTALREQAQQAILDGIDTTLDEINSKFDKLLESNQLLLEAMHSEIAADPNAFVENVLTTALRDGKLTNLEAESFVNDLSAAFGGMTNGIDWDNVSARTENNQLILNVNGQSITVDSSVSQNLYAEILAALTKAGYGK